ncbi:MAG: F0F1 ATP synthase subunit A [Deltaproteobacteria bacterium]|nr:F0F1 ATP synthase subunit A [Deltaproteobacteria bacterium]
MKFAMRIAALALVVWGMSAGVALAAGDMHTWSYVNPINDALRAVLHTDLDLSHSIWFTFVAIFLCVSGAIVGKSYKEKLRTGDIAPSPNFSLANVYESLIGMMLNLLEEIVGHHGRQYITLICSLAFVIVLTNFSGLTPASVLATSNLNTTAALALVVFVAYNYYGIKAHGPVKYAAHFLGPLEGNLRFVMAPIMVPIELISHVARPLSLSLRLFGNMTGDHTIFAVFMVGLGIAWPLLFPLPLYVLGTLVCFVQMLVFVMLTMVYLSLATAHDH